MKGLDHIRADLEWLEPRRLMSTTVSFQQGMLGYAGTQDTYIRADAPGTSFGNAVLGLADGDDNVAAGQQPVQSLIRFGNIFGAGLDQIPAGSTITSATLTIVTGSNSTDGSIHAASLHRMLVSFDETSTWNSLAEGISTGIEAEAQADDTKTPATFGAPVQFNVTSSLQAWAINPSNNLGWLLMLNGDNMWRWNTSESSNVAGRPMLSVTYDPPTNPVNQPPAVNAGADQTVELPGPANLDGTVVDDGISLPVNSVWSVVSGPGEGDFADANSVDTTATFSEVGEYILRLTTSDGEYQRSDDVRITVEHPASSIVTRSFAQGVGGYAGTQDTYIRQDNAGTSFGNSVLNLADSDDNGAPGAQPVQSLIRFDDLFGNGASQIPAGSIITGATLTIHTGANSTDGSIHAAALHRVLIGWNESSTWNSLVNGVSANGSDAVATPDGVKTPSTAGAPIAFDVTAALQSWSNDPSANNGWALLLGGDNMWRWNSSEAANSAVRPSLVIHYIPNPDPDNQAPAVHAGTDQTVILPGSASLNGTVTDDNLPEPAALETLWTVVSGPGSVIFGDDTLVDTSASFAVAGTYVLRLTANDGELSSFDEVTIEVQPQVTQHTRTFRNGSGGYASTQDTYIRTDTPSTSFGSATTALVDLVDGSGSSQALIRFEDIFGDGLAQIPAGATISSATLTIVTGLTSTDGSPDTIGLHRMLMGWNESSTWGSLVGGVSANGTEAAATPDGSVIPNTVGAAVTFNVTSSIAAWAANPNANFGWALNAANGGNAWRFNTSEFSTASLRPTLSITYQTTGDPQENQPPQVSAGPDQTVTLPAAASLNGTIVDDDLPDPPGAVTTLWSLVNGPGTVTFGNAGDVDTTAIFSAPGTYILQLSASDGEFTSSDQITITVQSSPIQVLNPVVADDGTGEKPQSKVWKHAGAWWTVFPISSGTWLFKLENTTWTPKLKLDSRPEGEADTLQVGDVTHIIIYDSADHTRLSSIQYDANAETYTLWSQRPFQQLIPLNDEEETVTIAMDGAGRLWLASDRTDSIEVRYSDGSYATWSAPITLATGIRDDDLCDIMSLPDGSVAVMWSNQEMRQFGFSTHAAGADPAVWSADEMPGAAGALNVGNGFADDHISTVVGSDGTVYAAIKTSYDTSGLPVIGLLVRRPNGQWDNLYTVDTDLNATRPNVVLNEARGVVMISYSVIPTEAYGDIMYRMAPLSNLSNLAPRQTLLAGGYNNVSSTRQIVDDDVVLIANDVNEFVHGVRFVWPSSAPLSMDSLASAFSSSPQISSDSDDLESLLTGMAAGV